MGNLSNNKHRFSVSKEYAKAILDTVRESLVVLDADLKVLSANRSFYKTFKVTQENTEGQLIFDLGNRQWNIPELKVLLEKVLPENKSFDDFEIEHDFEYIGKRTMVLNAKQFYHKDNDIQLILLAIEDETEIKTLRGIIPICAHCKEIRDDKGYWNRLEAYIERFSSVSFSHGICPKCSDKLYGGKDWYMKMKKKKK